MKANVKEIHCPPLSFPCLMKGPGNIVLMTAQTSGQSYAGVAVATLTNGYKIGETRKDWLIDSFKVFDGEVTLSN
jgi:hypothetical protein